MKERVADPALPAMTQRAVRRVRDRVGPAVVLAGSLQRLRRAPKNLGDGRPVGLEMDAELQLVEWRINQDRRRQHLRFRLSAPGHDRADSRRRANLWGTS